MYNIYIYKYNIYIYIHKNRKYNNYPTTLGRYPRHG